MISLELLVASGLRKKSSCAQDKAVDCNSNPSLGPSRILRINFEDI